MANRKKRRRKPKVFDAYRVDVSRRLVRVLSLAAFLVLLGSIAAGSAIVALRLEGVPLFHVEPALNGATPDASATPWMLGLAGIGLVLSGVLSAIIGLRRILTDERYLLLRSDGALFVRGTERRLVKWKDVEEVAHEHGELVFHCHDGRSLCIGDVWGGVTLEGLAKRAAHVRRRSEFGLS